VHRIAAGENRDQSCDLTALDITAHHVVHTPKSRN
jgi:hypothetical protein